MVAQFARSHCLIRMLSRIQKRNSLLFPIHLQNIASSSSFIQRSEQVEDSTLRLSTDLQDYCRYVVTNSDAYRTDIRDKVHVLLRQYSELHKNLIDLMRLQEEDEKKDSAWSEMLHADIAQAQIALRNLVEQFPTQLALPPGDEDSSDSIVEFQPGVGGEEAALFTKELCTMYEAFAAYSGWRMLSSKLNLTDLGGVRQATYEVCSPHGTYGTLKFEAGVHRVQRVPVTDRSRLHTSTASIVVQPKQIPIDIEIPRDDVTVEYKSSSGAGGMNVNRNLTAVRVKHLPTGIIVTSEEERVRATNEATAMNKLKKLLQESEFERRLARSQRSRKLQIGTSDRNLKIRTYNFPNDRIIDHRLSGQQTFRLSEVMRGQADLGELIERLKHNYTAEVLQEEVDRVCGTLAGNREL